MAHLGGIASRGPGLVCIEATGVQANGRISPQDVGIWKDSQIESHAKVVEFIHSQNQHAIIQLAHAGRKASTVAPWLSRGEEASVELDGWPDDVVAPSAISFSDKFPSPKALTLEQISELKTSFVEAAKRALKAGYDGIELHMAHGYMLHEFASPVSNERTDQYGGSFENRTRLHIELVDAVRAVIPEEMPLFVRISASDHLDTNEDAALAAKSWKIEDTVKLAHIFASHGVDVIDVSSGGNHQAQKVGYSVAYQADFANAVKKAVGDKVLVSTVGGISSGKVAEDCLEKGNLDLIAVGRAFQKNPGLVFSFADELEVNVRMPNQIQWAFGMPRTVPGSKK
jgi:2,4-dienoyl-CoA reductase-like NADH-dependent reductase (Old Yellow Enzyme family)